ncbi:MAG: SMC-Scp complex subunit ScpB [Minisyncoccia bacterium]
MDNDLEKKIEAVLFWKGEPMKIKKLEQIFAKNEEEILTGLKSLEIKIADRGIVLIFKDDEVALGTSQDSSEIIEKLRKEELVKDLGKAGLETLSIVIYMGPISRAEIDLIRGVQSSFILRNLTVRGLVEKISNPKDQRSFLYRPTFDLISFLGISKIEDMPEFLQAKEEIEKFKNVQKETENNGEPEKINSIKSEIDNNTNIVNE